MAFDLAFKSTVDKMAFDVATSNSLKLIDMDDVTAIEDLLGSNKNAFVWEFLTFDDAPKDPLYAFAFRIGARTTNDAANYNILSLLGSIKAAFTIGTTYEVIDYSGVAAGPSEGYMIVTGVQVEPQEFDKQSGIRTATISGRAARRV